jgi:sugar lactone lactonase YvrE
MVHDSFFAFVLGLLKPYTAAWHAKSSDNKQCISAVQRAADNKLLDLNVLRIIHDYIGSIPFYFTNMDVKIKSNILVDCKFTHRNKSYNYIYPQYLCELSDGSIAFTQAYVEKGGVYISRDNQIVQIIDSDMLRSPRNICTNSKNQLIVADIHSRKIHIFQRDGTYVRSFGGNRYDADSLSDPHGICQNSLGHILVVDSCEHTVVIFDEIGNIIKKIKCSEMRYPSTICVDQYDNIYVINSSNYPILKFSSSGKLLQTFGEYGRNYGQIHDPRDICVTPDGTYIVVTDHNGCKIIVISGTDGSTVAYYGGREHAHDITCLYPTGCTISADGRILVAASENLRIIEICKN